MDITTGAEKFGGPVLIQGSVSGTGLGGNGGTVSYDAQFQNPRPGLLLLNGVIYIAYGGYGDPTSWHGWIFSYNASTLKAIDIFCTTPNGTGGGIWAAGTGLTAEVNDPSTILMGECS